MSEKTFKTEFVKGLLGGTESFVAASVRISLFFVVIWVLAGLFPLPEESLKPISEMTVMEVGKELAAWFLTVIFAWSLLIKDYR